MKDCPNGKLSQMNLSDLGKFSELAAESRVLQLNLLIGQPEHLEQCCKGKTKQIN